MLVPRSPTERNILFLNLEKIGGVNLTIEDYIQFSYIVARILSDPPVQTEISPLKSENIEDD